MCVWEGGRGKGVGVSGGKLLLSYMHMAVHQLIAGREKRERKLVYSSPCGRPVFLCELKLHYFRDEGWEGLGGASNVCMMSKKGIKIKEGIMAEISLCFTTGEWSK